MSKKERIELVENLKNSFKKAEGMVATQYQGLTVAEVDELRAKLAAHKSEYRVVKNTLTIKALEGLGIQGFSQYFEGPTGIVIENGDPVPVAKVLFQFSQEHNKFKICAGYLSGLVLTAQQVKELSQVEPKPVLLQRFISSLHNPLYSLARTLNEPMTSLARVLQSLAKKKESSASS